MIKRNLVILFLSLSALYGCETFPEDLSWLDPTTGEQSQPAAAVEKPDVDAAGEGVILKADSGKQISQTKDSQQTVAAKPTSKKFDDWFVRCSAADGCMMLQQLRVKSGQLLFQITVKPINEDIPPRVEIVLPLGFYLPDQARLYVGASDAYHIFTVQKCVSEGCQARANNSTRLLAAMRQGTDKAKVVIRSRDERKPVNIAFSRRGFVPAYEYMMSLQ